MKPRPLLCLLLGLIALADAQRAGAQARRTDPKLEPPGRYVPFPFDPNSVEDLVRNRLDLAKDLEPLKDLVEQFSRDPEKLKLDPSLAEKFDLNDPALRKMLKDWAAKQAPDRAPAPEQMEKLKQNVEKLLKEAPRPTPPPGQLPDGPPDVKGPGAVPSGKLPEPPPDALKDWLTDFMEQAEESQLGDWLRDSPAWRDAFVNLQASLRESPDVQGRFGEWAGKLKLSERLPRLTETTLTRLRDLPRPRLPRLRFRPPRFAAPRAPALRPPGVPDWSAASLGTLLTWLLVVLLFGLLAWQATKWARRYAPRRRATAANLGPWPVRPEQVATRAELIQAFDYLALLALGPRAHTWNHRAAAQGLTAQSAAHADAIRRLADLYEQARYTEGDETLSAGDRDQARQALTTLSATVPA